VYIGSAIYTAGLQGVVQQFGVSDTAALLGLTVFVLGYAIGPMFLVKVFPFLATLSLAANFKKAPLSEMPFFGRNPIFIITLLAFVLLQLGVIYAKNFGMLLAFRFITGFIGSPVLATGGAAIADMYVPKKQAYGIGVWGVAAICGPVLGPLVGGFAVENEDWKWTIWELMWLSGASLIFLSLFLPETSSSNIIYRRTVRYRKITGNLNLKCQPELEAEGMTTNEIVQMLLLRPFTISFTEPIVFLLNLYIGLVYALLYLWFESFPIVFIGIYHFSLGTEGLAFIGILIGVFATMPPFFWYCYKYMEPLYNEKGGIKPEYRLKPAFVGAFFLPLCLFWFGWSARPSIHWIMPIIGSSFFTVGAFLLFQAVFTYLSDAYPKHVASVYAANDLVRSSFGAAFPLFANAMYARLGIAWGSSLLGFLSIVFIPIPFVLYHYGERIRGRSKMARHDL
jgi:DHA1 family multidrug resistance protein-like MFS transporter